MTEEKEVIVFGGGCFWCTEAIFKTLKGVISVDPGYAGGTKENPTYEEVSTGTTGYIEVSRVEFDPNLIDFHSLLTVFFASHDPTSMDAQGADVGHQYRSAIFYTNDREKEEAEKIIAEINASSEYGKPVVTEVLPLEKFYPAENYHKDYYEKHKEAPYCKLVIDPKLEKIRSEFRNLIKNQ